MKIIIITIIQLAFLFMEGNANANPMSKKNQYLKLGLKNTRMDSLKSLEYLKSGATKFKEKKYADAILDLDKAVFENPKNWEAFRLRADCKGELRMFKDAISDYSKALSIKGNDTIALKSRANTELLNNNFIEALRDFNIVISLVPNDEFLIFGRGQCLAHLNEYDKAIADFDFFIEKQPNWNSYPYLLRGLTYFESGQYRKSISDFNWYILKGAESDAVFYNRGVSYIHLGSSFVDSAIFDLKKYLINHKSSFSTFMNLGICYSMKMDSIETRSNFAKCLLISPENIEARYKWGAAELNFKNYAKSLELFDSVFPHITNPSYQNWYWLGIAKAGVKDTLGGVEAYGKAIKIDSIRQEVYAARIKLYYSSPKYSKILFEDINRLIYLTQDTKRLSLLYASRSLVYGRISNFKEANNDIQKAIELDEQLPINYLAKGILLSRQNNKAEEVLTNFNKAIEIDSKNKEAYLLKACVYGNLREYKKACEQLKKAESLEAKVPFPKNMNDRVCIGKTKNAISVSEMELIIYPFIKEAIVNP